MFSTDNLPDLLLLLGSIGGGGWFIWWLLLGRKRSKVVVSLLRDYQKKPVELDGGKNPSKRVNLDD